MTSSSRVLAVLLVLLGLCRSSAADWASDEAYAKRLDQHVKELKRIADLFEQQRRTLELVEFEFANLALPLADSTSSPEQIVQQVLAKSFPKVKVSMTQLPTHAPRDVQVWKWRCTLTGAVEEIRWATQLLLRKGLFVLPSQSEPVKLELEANQRRGTLTFVGHHVRLKEVAVPKLPQMPLGPDALAVRIDPLAQEIRRLNREVATLRKRVQDIMTFEARVEAMRQMILQLKTLTKGGRDPFRVFTPLLDLELVRFETLLHTGREVAIHAAIPSESARPAAARWLRKQRRRKLHYRFAVLRPIYGEPLAKELPLAEGDGAAGGPLCSLRLAGARALDLGLASGAQAFVAVGSESTEVSGEVARSPLRRGLAAAARRGGMALLWDHDSLLLLPRKESVRARRSLAEGIGPSGKTIAIHQLHGTVANALVAVRRGSPQPIAIAAPAEAMTSGATAAVSGRASVGGWLRLLGASLGLRLARGSGWQLRPPGKTEVRLVPLSEVSHASRSAAAEAAPLGQLRPRVLVTCGGPPRAIVAAPGGAPVWVQAGTRLGRGRSRVTRVDRRGVTVRWSEAGITAAVLLPFGERRRALAPPKETVQPETFPRSVPASPDARQMEH